MARVRMQRIHPSAHKNELIRFRIEMEDGDPADLENVDRIVLQIFSETAPDAVVEAKWEDGSGDVVIEDSSNAYADVDFAEGAAANLPTDELTVIWWVERNVVATGRILLEFAPTISA